MQGFVQGANRRQTTLFPECLDDWVDESNSIRAIDVFVDALELRDLAFDGVDPAATGRPAYHPSAMLPEICNCSRRLLFQRRRRLSSQLALKTVFVIALENHDFTQPNAKCASALRPTIARHP
jgi:hypothetical protein